MGLLRLQLHQRKEGICSMALAHRLQQLSYRNQGNNHGSSFKIKAMRILLNKCAVLQAGSLHQQTKAIINRDKYGKVT